MLPDLRPISAGLASLILALGAVVAAGTAFPQGEPIALATRSAHPPGVLCVEQRLVIVRVAPHRKFYVNDDEALTQDDLRRRLATIFKTRAEKVVYVLGDPEASFGEVAYAIGLLREASPNVGLLTISTVPTFSEPLLNWRGAYPMKTRWD